MARCLTPCLLWLLMSHVTFDIEAVRIKSRRTGNRAKQSLELAERRVTTADGIVASRASVVDREAIKAALQLHHGNSTKFGLLELTCIALAVGGLSYKVYHHHVIEDNQCGVMLKRFLDGSSWTTTGFTRFTSTALDILKHTLADLAFAADDLENLPQVDCENMINGLEVQLTGFVFRNVKEDIRGSDEGIDVMRTAHKELTLQDFDNPAIINEQFIDKLRFFVKGKSRRDAMIAVRAHFAERHQAKEPNAANASEQTSKEEAVFRVIVPRVMHKLQSQGALDLFDANMRTTLTDMRERLQRMSQIEQTPCEKYGDCVDKWQEYSESRDGVACAKKLVIKVNKSRQGFIPAVSYGLGWGLKLAMIKMATIADMGAKVIDGLWVLGIPDITLALTRYISRGLGLTKKEFRCSFMSCKWNEEVNECEMDPGESAEIPAGTDKLLPAAGMRCVVNIKNAHAMTSRKVTTCQLEACPHAEGPLPVPAGELWNCAHSPKHSLPRPAEVAQSETKS